jgi:hypothetical protein
MKIGKKYFIIRERIFNRKVNVFLNYSGKDFNKWCNKKNYKQDDHEEKDNDLIGFSTEMSGEDTPTEWIIVCNNFDWTIKDQGTLIHEIVHTVIKIWNRNNMKVCLETQEFFAHEINNLYEDICCKIWKFKKK